MLDHSVLDGSLVCPLVNDLPDKLANYYVYFVMTSRRRATLINISLSSKLTITILNANQMIFYKLTKHLSFVAFKPLFETIATFTQHFFATSEMVLTLNDTVLLICVLNVK